MDRDLKWHDLQMWLRGRYTCRTRCPGRKAFLRRSCRCLTPPSLELPDRYIHKFQAGFCCASDGHNVFIIYICWMPSNLSHFSVVTRKLGVYHQELKNGSTVGSARRNKLGLHTIQRLVQPFVRLFSLFQLCRTLYSAASGHLGAVAVFLYCFYSFFHMLLDIIRHIFVSFL